MNNKEKLILTTAELIREKGFCGTAIGEIVIKTNIPKGSIYHYFPNGKDDLVVEALKYASNKQLKLFTDVMIKKRTVESSLHAIIDTLIEEMENSKYSKSCPLATVTLEISARNDKIGNTCKEIYNEWEKYLEIFLIRKKVKNAAEVSKTFFVLIEGAYVMCKANRNTEHLKLIKGLFKKIISL